MATGGPNNTSPSYPVVDFVPQKQYPSFSTIINQSMLSTVGTITGGTTTVTITAAQVLSGLILHDTSSQPLADVLPTAALLVPAIEGAQIGSTSRFLLRNTSAGAGTITVSAGTGGTAHGTLSIPYLQQMEFLLRVSAVDTPTYDLYPMGVVTF